MTRRAIIRTAHTDPETIAAAIAPDNTDEMRTRVERDRDDRSVDEDAPPNPTADGDAGDAVVVTTIDRDSTSGLHATVDDTLVNLAVADRVAALARGADRSTGLDAAPERDRVESTDDQPTTDTTDTS